MTLPAAMIAALLLLQFAVAPPPAPQALPKYFPYEREMRVAPGHSGEACAVLDADVLARAENASLSDARVYVDGRDETASLIDENTTQTTGEDQAVAHHAVVQHGDLAFDLTMPRRPYSAVVLDLAAHDFIAIAQVTAVNQAGAAVQLGSFPIYDLSSQKLGRTTTLSLQESDYPELHIVLHPIAAGPVALHALQPNAIRGAAVPPSREAQVLYTTVAETSVFVQRGRQTLATLLIPAHVPVERIVFALPAGYSGAFLRNVTVTATPDQPTDTAAVETVSGEISQITNLRLPAELANWHSLFEFRRLALDTTLGANLRHGATVQVAVDNGRNPPLPFTAVKLQMRQRRVCFWASPVHRNYVLMYGDPSLRPPVYTYDSGFYAGNTAIVAALGPPENNPGFTARVDTRTYSQRHPELWWVILLGTLAAVGSFLRHRARY